VTRRGIRAKIREIEFQYLHKIDLRRIAAARTPPSSKPAGSMAGRATRAATTSTVERLLNKGTCTGSPAAAPPLAPLRQGRPARHRPFSEFAPLHRSPSRALSPVAFVQWAQKLNPLVASPRQNPEGEAHTAGDPPAPASEHIEPSAAKYSRAVQIDHGYASVDFARHPTF